MSSINEALRVELIRLHDEDQKQLAELDEAKDRDPEFASALEQRTDALPKPAAFYTLRLYEQWASEPACPKLVKHHVAFRRSVTARLKAVVAEHGWPDRALVGDDAAFFVYFLFGHADTDNEWRRTQLDAITKSFRAGEVEPRLYAHVCDRVEVCDGKPQLYGTAIGPADAPGKARVYWQLAGGADEVDARRRSIGLPPMEEDLAKYRQGAIIGPYMTPTFTH